MVTDNCGTLADCLPSARGLLIALAAVLIVVGIAALLAGTGGMAAGPLAALLEGGGLALASGGVASSAGAISTAAAAELAATGAVSTAAGIMLAQVGPDGYPGGPDGSSGQPGPNAPDMPQKPPAIRPDLSSEDPRINNLLDNIYKGTNGPNRIGDGTTMDAVRNEIATGRPTGGTFHSTKARETINGLMKWLDRNPTAAGDRSAVQDLIQQLRNALEGQP
jgi:hypothetical protein